MTQSVGRRFAVVGIYPIAFTLVLGFVSIRSQHNVEASQIGRDANPSGQNEVTVAVIAGAYDSEASAISAANEELSLGDIQGFYVTEAQDFEVQGAYRVLEGRWQQIPCAQVAPGTDQACDRGTGTMAVLGEPRLQRIPNGREFVPRESQCLLDCGGETLSPVLASMAASRGPVQLSEAVDGDWVLITAFRTKAGAESFLEVLRAVYDQPTLDRLVVLQLRNVLGNRDIGLGQETHPNGSGRLNGPLVDQEDYQ